ncbi:hypothetical protein ACFSJM_00020 [Lactococcus formosensis subsp. bovis]|uniref:hypothetical protein n=1 Tax=Lactococcus formosensis TaxID=1281486 RepID=UPI001BCBFD6F|nr:hypothetical protein [Lactococcus formosensis]
MTSKTIKDFAQEINLDKKQLQNKLAYWKKKGKETWNFSDTFSDGIRTLTNAEQQRIRELLGLPFLRQVSDDPEELSDTKIQTENILHKEKLSLIERQLKETQSDKEYLKSQVIHAQNENEELIKANAELRILLQNSMKQAEKLQIELSELSSENKKEDVLLNTDNTETKDIQTPSEKSSEFIFNPQHLKKSSSSPKFEELYPDYQGFFSELFKYKRKKGNWKFAYRHARRLSRLKQKENIK